MTNGVHAGHIAGQQLADALFAGAKRSTADQCSVGGCESAPEATITIAGFPLRMCGDHARLIEGALERRQEA